MNKDFTQLASSETIAKTQKALEDHGISSSLVETKEAAKEEVLRHVPKGAEILTNTSATLEQIGLTELFNESGEYVSVYKKLLEIYGDKSQEKLKRQLGAAPDYAVGSLLAITENGELYFASATGSQLPGYAYGAKHVVLVVGTHKIVKDLTEAQQRLNEHVFPLEDVRSQKAYGTGSSVNKELVIRQDTPGRTHVVFVAEPLGY